MTNSRPIRVLHIIDGLGGGGCERWLWDIIRLSNPDSFEHFVITTHPDTGNYFYAERLRALGAYQQAAGSRAMNFLWNKSQNSERRSIPVSQLSTLLWRLGSYGLTARALRRALKKFTPDVIHTHTYYASFVAGLIGKGIIGKRLVHTVPAMFSQMEDTGLGRMPGLYAHLHRWVDCFITGVSYDDLLGLGIPSAKIRQILCGVNLEEISAARKERDHYYRVVRRSLALPEDALIALSVGRLHPSKGHLFALESLPALIKQFPNIHWLVLGKGPQDSALQTRAKDLGVAEHVHLLGFQGEPLSYYAAADVYLRTPVFEAENLSSYQAIAMGLPVLGFDTGCETELINKIGHGILVPNRDSAALAAAVEQILRLPDRGQLMGELGANYSQEHFDIRQIASTFFSVYTVLNGQ